MGGGRQYFCDPPFDDQKFYDPVIKFLIIKWGGGHKNIAEVLLDIHDPPILKKMVAPLRQSKNKNMFNVLFFFFFSKKRKEEGLFFFFLKETALNTHMPYFEYLAL